jgi:hypothetical protein
MQGNVLDTEVLGLPDPDPSITKHKLTIYAPMIYTAPCVIVLMRADTVCGEVGGGGLALEIESFWAP